ncbi:tyrosine-protein phosphatase non-receptor type 9 isoform X2 [Anthonomus grandis grandis]|uniref:tyrosine-protein phosphatase non-receptor type 9 isoform X2 n=1 Tax=Anthonomus grandis grandis TaxID=2921223 RepID=UPI0021667866|nr:tyrosine-protein phosphatase non-receptor type 9 isoform X2 [Anthonomus grandis grandis]
MSEPLTPEQELITKEFLERVNIQRYKRKFGSTPVSWPTAVRFLYARKFDVNRAVALFEQHEATRQREGLNKFDPREEPLKSELLTGKFTVLPGRDSNDAAIAVFTAHKHVPANSSHQTTLQGVVYQLDVALQDHLTQKSGIVFIYDMSNSKYSNFDYDLSQKILTMLKGGYPAKLKKVLIVTAPLWFKAPFKILRLFVREKLRERVYTISAAQLQAHIPRDSLPLHLGGVHALDHDAWLERCASSSMNHDLLLRASPTGLPPSYDNKSPTSGRNHIEILHQKSKLVGGDGAEVNKGAVVVQFGGTRSKSGGTLGGGEEGADVDTADQWSHSDETNLNPPSSASSGFSDDDSLPGDGAAVTIGQLVEMVRLRGRSGLVQEYAEIRARLPEGSFNVAKSRCNLPKNRYTDVLCYDHSRVVLSEIDCDKDSDYIHANFVDGYKQKNAFINTQGPLAKTTPEFWRMIWEQHTLVIVMTTRVMERGRPKCHQYWESEKGAEVTYGHFLVKTLDIETDPNYTVTTISLTNKKTEETREVSHWQFTSWPDYGVPSSAKAMLEFLERVRRQQAAMVNNLGDTWAGHPRGPPIVVHCSAGIGRTGTFCTLDICISRLEDVGTVDIRGTVERIRAQRAYSIQMPDQYIFCHLALIEYALSKGHLQSVDLTDFDHAVAEDSD